MLRARRALDPAIEAALLGSDRYARGKVGQAQAALLAALAPDERLRAIAVDIDNVAGVVVVTDRRLLAFREGRLRQAVGLASVSGWAIHRLSSCSFAVAVHGPGLQLHLPAQPLADRFVEALAAPAGRPA